MRIALKLLIRLCLLAVCFPAVGQRFAAKTNILYDAALSPNIGIEMKLAPKWTLDVSGNYNGWAIDDHRWKHWFVQPEARYWLCEAWNGHFFGVHAIGGEYNFGNIGGGINFLGSDFSQLASKRYQGWAAGLGIAYGYTWILSHHWSVEAEIGLGWIYTRYDSYPCTHCGTKLESDKSHNYVGPTKAAINFIYVF